ncbi:MAG: UDP-glucose 4-epimerase GalE [Pseudomonadota bacterium]
MRVLVIGGAGYIGSHMCKMLAEQGHTVHVLDNLSTGHKEACRFGTLHIGDLSDVSTLHHVFNATKPEAVMHFAGKSIVAESISDPSQYYFTNFVGTATLADYMSQQPGLPLVFSSTAAIFGAPQTERIGERHPCNPINPYGASKLAAERLLADYWAAYGQSSVTFRYFNAAGADPSGEIGEAHEPETHLIPKILDSVLHQSEPISVNGIDYSTSDGTCVRDFVHVNDICRAHLLGLNHLLRAPGVYAFNLGNGNGYSVKQVLSAAEQVVGKPIPHRIGERRLGDPAVLVADASHTHAVLGWKPQLPGLEEMIETAWRWHKRRHGLQSGEHANVVRHNTICEQGGASRSVSVAPFKLVSRVG